MTVPKNGRHLSPRDVTKRIEAREEDPRDNELQINSEHLHFPDVTTTLENRFTALEINLN